MSDFSPFEGKTLKGWPVATVKAGKIIARDGKIVGKANGRYLPRKPAPARHFEWFRSAQAGRGITACPFLRPTTRQSRNSWRALPPKILTLSSREIGAASSQSV